MKTISHGLVAAGQTISDEELVLYILGGLGPKFEYVIVHLTSKDCFSSRGVVHASNTWDAFGAIQYIQQWWMSLQKLNMT